MAHMGIWDLILIYPMPYSIYLRWTIGFRAAIWQFLKIGGSWGASGYIGATFRF